MIEIPIPVLGSDFYQSFIANVGDGRQALTHIATLSIDGSTKRFFVKAFPSHHDKGLINEATCYLLAKNADLPVPAHGVFIQLTPQMVNNAFPDITVQEPIFCWAVSEERGHTPNTYLPSKIMEYNATKRVLASFESMSDVVSFDALIANNDRNTGNIIIRPGNKGYCLIDHSDAPVKSSWSPEELDPKYSHNCKLSAALWNSELPLPVKSAMLNKANTHSKLYNRLSKTLDSLWSVLCHNDSASRTALSVFFEQRSENHEDYLKDKHKILL